MKWVILVYLSIHANIGLPPDDMRYKRIELPARNFEECIDISQQINDIVKGYRSNVGVVRSLYWVYNNMLEDIKAECIYGEPMAPSTKWENNNPWLWKNLVEDNFLTPEPPPQ